MLNKIPSYKFITKVWAVVVLHPDEVKSDNMDIIKYTKSKIRRMAMEKAFEYVDGVENTDWFMFSAVQYYQRNIDLFNHQEIPIWAAAGKYPYQIEIRGCIDVYMKEDYIITDGTRVF